MMRMKKGFYEELDEIREEDEEACFAFLENEQVSEEVYAYQYLHGDCPDFAAMLNEVYGYSIECVRYPDEDNVSGKLIHAYCVANFNGEKAYVDVRGMTTDPVLFFEEFENELTYFPKDGMMYCTNDKGYEVPVKLEIWENKDMLFDGDYEGWTDEKIKRFILDYADYYDVERTEMNLTRNVKEVVNIIKMNVNKKESLDEKIANTKHIAKQDKESRVLFIDKEIERKKREEQKLWK